MPVGLAGVALGGHRIGEGEEPGTLAASVGEVVGEGAVLVVEHRLEALSTDIAAARTVDGVGDGHVVRRDALGDRARGAAHPEEPAGHFLPRADLGEGPVFRGRPG